MQRNKLVALGVGIAGLAYLLFNRARKDVFGLQYSVVGVSSLNVMTLEVSLQVKVTNPTATPFPLYNTTLTGTVSVNDSLVLGTATGSANQLLAPGSAIVIPVTAQINPAVFGYDVAQLLQLLNQNGVLFNFSGKIIVGGVSSPVNLSYKVL